MDKPLCEVVVDDETKIEDFEGMLQADFANMHLGGGVLIGGNVQEEIRFGLASPELLVGMLVSHENMAHNEAIILTGTELVSRYKGYGGHVDGMVRIMIRLHAIKMETLTTLLSLLMLL